MDEDVYKVARYVGLPGETLTRFVGALEAVGYTIAKKAVSSPDDQAVLAQRPEESKLVALLREALEVLPGRGNLRRRIIQTLDHGSDMNNGGDSK